MGNRAFSGRTLIFYISLPPPSEEFNPLLYNENKLYVSNCRHPADNNKHHMLVNRGNFVLTMLTAVRIPEDIQTKIIGIIKISEIQD